MLELIFDLCPDFVINFTLSAAYLNVWGHNANMM